MAAPSASVYLSGGRYLWASCSLFINELLAPGSQRFLWVSLAMESMTWDRQGRGDGDDGDSGIWSSGTATFLSCGAVCRPWLYLVKGHRVGLLSASGFVTGLRLAIVCSQKLPASSPLQISLSSGRF